VFGDLKEELAKLESTVKSAFDDVKQGVAEQRRRIQNLEGELPSNVDRVHVLVEKTESTVRLRMNELLEAIERLVT
jgi:hypothetical protein